MGPQPSVTGPIISSAAFGWTKSEISSPIGSGSNRKEHLYCTKNKVNYLFATNPKVSLISHFHSVNIGRRVSGGLSRRPSRVKVFFLQLLFDLSSLWIYYCIYDWFPRKEKKKKILNFCFVLQKNESTKLDMFVLVCDD